MRENLPDRCPFCDEEIVGREMEHMKTCEKFPKYNPLQFTEETFLRLNDKMEYVVFCNKCNKSERMPKQVLQQLNDCSMMVKTCSCGNIIPIKDLEI